MSNPWTADDVILIVKSKKGFQNAVTEWASALGTEV